MRFGPNAFLSLLLAAACTQPLPQAAAATPDPASADFFVSPRGNDPWSGKLADPGRTTGRSRRSRAPARPSGRCSRPRSDPGPSASCCAAGPYYLDAPLEFGPEDSGTRERPGGLRRGGGRESRPERGTPPPGRSLGRGQRPQGLGGGPPGGEGRPTGGSGNSSSTASAGRGRGCRSKGNTASNRCRAIPATSSGARPSSSSMPRATSCPAGATCGTWKSSGSRGGWTTGCRSRASTRKRAPSPSTARACLPSSRATSPGPTGWRTSSRRWTRPASGISIARAASLYYLPRPGEDMPSAEIVAPRLTQVVRVVGRAGAPVHDLRFEGLTFAHTEWQPPADYASSLQAGIEVPGALLFDYAERCAVTGGGIEHIGNYGVEVGVGCADIEIARNRITDIGAGGVRIGHFFSWETDGSGQLTERGMPAQGRHAEGPAQPADHGGRQRNRPLRAVHPGSGGRVRGRQRRQCKVVHNHIHDLFYSGISVGSVQDFGPSQATGNVVEYNHVHDIGQGMLSDLAGIYTCSTPGSRIRFNVVHDVARRDYGGWGIYPDEGSHDLLIQKNLVYRCQDGALFAHHNRDITAENNIFALNRGAQIERGGIGGFELTCRRNLFYYEEGRPSATTAASTRGATCARSTTTSTGTPPASRSSSARRPSPSGRRPDRTRTASSPTRCSWTRRRAISGCGRALRRRRSASSRGTSRRSARARQDRDRDESRGRRSRGCGSLRARGPIGFAFGCPPGRQSQPRRVSVHESP